MNGNVVPARVFHAPQHQDLRATGREFEHLLEGDGVELLGVGDDARIGGVHAVDVGVYLADVGLEGRRQRDGGGVGATATEGGDVLGVLRDTLESGDQHDLAVVERATDAARRDVDDLGLAVRARRDDAGL